MKQNFHSFGLLFFLLILISSQTSARLLATNQAGPDNLVKLNNISIVNNSPSAMDGDESLEKLMGVEECKIGDEECLKRRAIEDVHLDYIYTQHHKP